MDFGDAYEPWVMPPPPDSNKRYKLEKSDDHTWTLSKATDASNADDRSEQNFNQSAEKILDGAKDDSECVLVCQGLDAESLNAFMYHLQQEEKPLVLTELKIEDPDDENTQSDVEEVRTCQAMAVRVNCARLRKITTTADDIYLEKCPQLQEINCSQHTTIHFEQSVPKKLNFADVNVMDLVLDLKGAVGDAGFEIVPPQNPLVKIRLTGENAEQFINTLTDEQKACFVLPSATRVASAPAVPTLTETATHA